MSTRQDTERRRQQRLAAERADIEAGARRRRRLRLGAGATRHRPSLAAAVLCLALAGCGSGGSATDHPAGRTADDAPRQRLSDHITGSLIATLRRRDAVWRTDFSRHSVSLDEFQVGGPPRDGIPPLDHPRSVRVWLGDRFLADREPVIAVVRARQARAYPLQILLWHEIVNDRLGGTPVAVTYCPLCNSGVVFDRRVGGRTLRFGTTGKLRNSNLVMWDRQTESWWQQLTGEGLVGRYTGTRLRPLESEILSWSDFEARYPHGTVLARPRGFDRPYGTNPYAGYDDQPGRPRLYDGRLDPRLPPRERVVAVHVGSRVGVVAFSRLSGPRVVSAHLGRTPVVVLYKRGVTSALDAYNLKSSRDVGTAAAFVPRAAGRRVDLVADRGDTFRDRRTGSIWDITGRAIVGPLKGARMRPLPDDQQFWFALAAFVPHARLLGTAPSAAPTADIRLIARTLRDTDVYVDPAVNRLVDSARLRRATAIASRAADGASIKLAFVNISDAQLDRVRDRLFEALDLDARGALVVTTPVSIAMRTKTLHPAAEQAIVETDAVALRSPPRDYTSALSELVYDTGLVIHNSAPGAVPRGHGANRNLRTFTGRFEGEKAGGAPTWLLVALVGGGAAAAAGAGLWALRRRP
jgi:Protein of unknown function (DUF3179)